MYVFVTIIITQFSVEVVGQPEPGDITEQVLGNVVLSASSFLCTLLYGLFNTNVGPTMVQRSELVNSNQHKDIFNLSMKF